MYVSGQKMYVFERLLKFCGKACHAEQSEASRSFIENCKLKNALFAKNAGIIQRKSNLKYRKGICHKGWY